MSPKPKVEIILQFLLTFLESALVDEVVHHKYSSLRRLDEIEKPGTRKTQDDEITGEVLRDIEKEKAKKAQESLPAMPRSVRNTLTKVFEMLQPLYLGTFYVPPKNVQLPPAEVANKDLHQDKLLEIRQHWVMKLMAYAAKDGVICIFDVSHTISLQHF